MNMAAMVQERINGLFPHLLGMHFTDATPERVSATLTVRDELCTVPGVLHGGAIMAFADTLGAVATLLNLGGDEGTTTIESKTNFLASVPTGATLTGECVPLHRGKRTMVWQTQVRVESGQVVAVVTQTQMVLHPQRTPQETMAALFTGKSPAEQRELLAMLERAGAALYRSWAAEEANPTVKATLLAAAGREEENARTLEGK